jgi:hypothetical protein
LKEAKEVIQQGNGEVAGRCKENSREVGCLAAEEITRGYWQKKECIDKSRLNKFDHNNIEIVLGFCKNKMFPIYRFLEPSMLIFLLFNKQSLCVKLIGLIEKPRKSINPIDHEFYWSNTVIMINKKYVEIRSNFNTEVKRLYISKFEYVIYQIISSLLCVY